MAVKGLPNSFLYTSKFATNIFIAPYHVKGRSFDLLRPVPVECSLDEDQKGVIGGRDQIPV